ncbi:MULTISPECIES: LptF/LptG family permease [unclassified Campylobacter]|uniref:LptF/LptG family permease n=1 Tax=unclassified Campylobacter TaxID=2593542 RepID=UPI003D3494F5
MRLYARYVAWEYFKAFLIIFLALELFYVGIDLLTNLKDLPRSANLQLLYVGLTSLTAVSYVLPISLVFANIIAHINMVRSNELVSLYALGVSKNSVIFPQFFIALFITLFYVGLNCTSFAYAYDYQKNIAKNSSFTKSTTDTFIKFEGKFIYIKELNSITNEALNIDIFDLNETDLKLSAFAKSAKFKDGIWQLKDVNLTKIPSLLELGSEGLDIQNLSQIDGLKGFKPKSIQSANAEQASTLNIPDTLDFIFTFKDEGVEINTAKTVFYNLAIFPFFAPFLMMIFYYKLPVAGRFFNLALASFIFVLIALVAWGVLFVLVKFSQSGIVLPEIAILAPVILLILYAIYLVKKHY